MLYPLMLLGLLGLGVPIVLHLIQRQRLKPQVLATLHFLEPQDAANAFAPVPRDWLQLLLRLTLLALFVLLMTRLFKGGSEPGPRSIVVVLDQSLSMQRKLDGESLFERHRRHILELIDSMSPQDRLAVIAAGDAITLDTGFLQDRAALRERVEGIKQADGTFEGGIKVSDGGGLALAPAIRHAVGLFGGRREVNACVLVFSDHQRASYQPALEELKQEGSGNVARAFRESLEQGRVKLLLVEEKLPDGPNLSVERAAFEPASVHVGGSSRLTAVVRNHSDKPQTTQVRLSEGEQADAPRSLTLEPSEAAHIDLVHRFESQVDAVCRVEIDEDILPADNRFLLPVRVRTRRQVLLVTPPSDSGDDRNLEIGTRGVDLLAYAVNPGEVLGRGAGTFVGVKRVSPAMLGKMSLPLYSVVILLGVTELPEKEAKDLAGYVASGGGLWIIPEGDVSPVRFRSAYEKLLGGFVLGALHQPNPVEGLLRDESRLQHPLLLPLLREEWGSLRELHFSQYHRVQELGTGKVALRSANGDPLAVLIPQGRGQVFVQLFGAGLEAGSLPRTTSFVPLVQEIAAGLGPRRDRLSPDTIRAGEARQLEVPEFRGLRGEVALLGPVQRTLTPVGDDGGEVRVTGLTRAGTYELKHSVKRSERQRWLTVNHVAGVSQLEPLDDSTQAELFGTKNISRLPYSDLEGQFENNREIFGPVVLLVLLAFVAEAVVGAWQARRKKRSKASRGHRPAEAVSLSPGADAPGSPVEGVR